MSTSRNDIDLVRLCLSGSEQGWAELYDRFYRLVAMVVKRRLRVTPQGLEDVTQEVFMALTTALKNYNPDYSLQKYICTIAERICVDQYRLSTAAKRDAETESLDDHLYVETSCQSQLRQNENQEEELAHRQETDFLRQSIRMLGQKCRELLRLRYLEELSYSEISRILKASENTLTVQTARCIRELKSVFQKLITKRE